MDITSGLESFELGPIRPPSEAFSLLIRVTRNCSWNRCRFCSIYKGEKFQLRPVADVKQDIRTAKVIHDKIQELAAKSGSDIRETAAMVCNSAPNAAYRNVALWMYAGGKQAFFQDANTLIMRTDELLDVIDFLKETFPGIGRITSYARSKTAAKKSLEEMVRLHEAGLSRLHIGMESGYDPVLKLVDKGVTAADHIAGGKNVVASGISLSEYVIPGLGGRTMWRENALETARVLNEINPDFIRVRTMTVTDRMLLREDVASGALVRQNDEEIVAELKLLLESLTSRSRFVSDHMINLLPEVEGDLPDDKEKMLAVIERFLAMPVVERDNYKLGRRLGIYERLDDMDDARRHEEIEQAMERLAQEGGGVSDELLFGLMSRYI